MPRLLKNIQGEILDNFETTTYLVTSITGYYGEEDYILMGGFEAFLQDFGSNSDDCQTRQAQSVEDYTVPPNFGLKNNIEFTTLEISY
jgi:hypothetical protein